jgi:hypothetical protein
MYYELLSQDEERHARLKNVLEKLIVVYGPARLDFKYPAQAGCMSIGVEALQDFSLSPEEHRNNDFFLCGLPLFNPESELFQSRP